MSKHDGFGRYISRRRKQLGMTQAELAKRMGVSKSAVAKWEADGGFPDRDNLKALSVALNVSTSELHRIIEGRSNTDAGINITQDVIAALESYGYRVVPGEEDVQ